MLDVHPPHHAAATWRDFFIHIATICVGLLIAICLEQSVEAIHRHNERTDLRESLRHESEQIVYDASGVEGDSTRRMKWLQQMEAQISATTRDRKQLGPMPPGPKSNSDNPDDPFFKAARASGRLTLLTEQEVVAYGELDSTVESYRVRFEALLKESQALQSLQREIQFALSTGPTAQPTTEQLSRAYTAMADLELAISACRDRARQTRGAATAMLAGERDLKKIEMAERQFYSLP